MKLSCDFVRHDDLCVAIAGERERNGYVLWTGANDCGGFAVLARVLKSDCNDFVHSWRVASPNDRKLSERGARRAACVAGSAGSRQRDARNGSLQRMVSRYVGCGLGMESE